MGFRLMVNIVDDAAPEDHFGNTEMIAEGRYNATDYATACDCNAAAGAALYAWLGANCSEWESEEVNFGIFERDEDGIGMFTYSGSATLRRALPGAVGRQIGMLIVQFYGMRT